MLRDPRQDRGEAVAVTLARILIVILLAHPPILWAQPQLPKSGKAAPETHWARIQHPALPVTLDMPADAATRQVRSFPLGSPRGRGGRRQEFTLFGIRSLDKAGLRYRALEVALFSIDAGTHGIEASELVRLAGRIRDVAAIESLVLHLLYETRERVELRDLGLEFIDGLPGRRFAVERLVAPGTPDERHISGEIVLLPLDRTSAMIVMARFDPKATPRERKALFLRILRSIRLDDRPSGALDAASPPAGPVSPERFAPGLS